MPERKVNAALAFIYKVRCEENSECKSFLYGFLIWFIIPFIGLGEPWKGFKYSGSRKIRYALKKFAHNIENVLIWFQPHRRLLQE